MDTNTTVAAESASTIARVFAIPRVNLRKMEEKLAFLARRARRLGCPAVTMTIGDSREVEVKSTDIDGTVWTEVVEVVDVTVEGKAPSLNGWRFAATVDHDGEENIIRGLIAGYPAHYRTGPATCEHCKTRRNRAETFILLSDAGEWTRVGRSCLKDFLGHSDPLTVAAMAEMLAEAFEDAGGFTGGEDGFSGTAGDPEIGTYLSYVALSIRRFGWVSRSKCADEQLATADMASHWLADRRHAAKTRTASTAPVPTAEDSALAAAALEWARAIGAAGGELSDFQHNVRAAAKRSGVSGKNMGVTAYIVAGYQREQGAALERATSNYVGTVGCRFGAKGTKKAPGLPALVLNVVRVLAFEGEWGTVYRNIMRDDLGNAFMWKGSECLKTGGRYAIIGTCKEHSEYNGLKQTVLTRCKAELVVEGDASNVADAA